MATRDRSGSLPPARLTAEEEAHFESQPARCAPGNLAVVVRANEEHLGLFLTVERRKRGRGGMTEWAVRAADGRAGWFLDVALQPIKGAGTGSTTQRPAARPRPRARTAPAVATAGSAA